MKQSSPPFAWYQKAVVLLAAAERLASTFPALPIPESAYLDEAGEPRPAGGSIPADAWFEMELNFGMIEVAKMLAGSSAESALKGMICLKGPPPRASHKLRGLYASARPMGSRLAAFKPVDLDELLAKLEMAVRWSARYPHSLDGQMVPSISTEDCDQAITLATLLCRELQDRLNASRPLAPT